MAFRASTNNPLPEIVELHSSMNDLSPSSLELKATLLINPEEIDVGDFTLQVEVSEAYVSVDAFGCIVDPHSKYGKRVHSQTISRTVATERRLGTSVSTTIANEAAAEFSFSMVDAALRTGGKRNKSDTSSTEVSLTERHEHVTSHFPVEAVGNNRWKVRNESGDPLRGHYLDDVELCRLSRSSNPTNRLGASVSVEVAKRNISVTVLKDRRFFGTTPNKERLLSILVAKRLAKVTPVANERALTFSVVEVEDEG